MHGLLATLLDSQPGSQEVRNYIIIVHLSNFSAWSSWKNSYLSNRLLSVPQQFVPTSNFLYAENQWLKSWVWLPSPSQVCEWIAPCLGMELDLEASFIKNEGSGQWCWDYQCHRSGPVCASGVTVFATDNCPDSARRRSWWETGPARAVRACSYCTLIPSLASIPGGQSLSTRLQVNLTKIEGPRGM